jgi:hypothetical protein
MVTGIQVLVNVGFWHTMADTLNFKEHLHGLVSWGHFLF